MSYVWARACVCVCVRTITAAVQSQCNENRVRTLKKTAQKQTQMQMQYQNQINTDLFIRATVGHGVILAVILMVIATIATIQMELPTVMRKIAIIDDHRHRKPINNHVMPLRRVHHIVVVVVPRTVLLVNIFVLSHNLFALANIQCLDSHVKVLPILSQICQYVVHILEFYLNLDQKNKNQLIGIKSNKWWQEYIPLNELNFWDHTEKL